MNVPMNYKGLINLAKGQRTALNFYHQKIKLPQNNKAAQHMLLKGLMK